MANKGLIVESSFLKSEAILKHQKLLNQQTVEEIDIIKALWRYCHP